MCLVLISAFLTGLALSLDFSVVFLDQLLVARDSFFEVAHLVVAILDLLLDSELRFVDRGELLLHDEGLLHFEEL